MKCYAGVDKILMLALLFQHRLMMAYIQTHSISVESILAKLPLIACKNKGDMGLTDIYTCVYHGYLTLQWLSVREKENGDM